MERPSEQSRHWNGAQAGSRESGGDPPSPSVDAAGHPATRPRADSAATSSKRPDSSAASSTSTEDGSARPSSMKAYGSGQSLTTVLNNPRLGKAGVYGDASWSTWISQSTQRNGEPAQDGPPPLPEGMADVSMSEFIPYLSQIAEPYRKYSDVSKHSLQEQAQGLSAPESEDGGSQSDAGSDRNQQLAVPESTSRQRAGAGSPRGEGLSACLREVPPLYFDEQFALERRDTFQAVCPNSSIPSSMLLQEKLSHYLDLVEVHLVQEISSRSESFFDALEKLEELNARITDTCGQLAGLRQSVQLLDGDLLESARHLQRARIRRENLLSLYHKLKLVDFVHQALATLNLLVSSNDCSGALDVIDDLFKITANDDLKGLHCLRHISQSLLAATDSVNSVLSAEFLRVAVHSSSDIEPPASIVAAFNRRKKVGGTVALDAVLALESQGVEEGTSALKEQLLPVILGLLRTSTLPSVLRAYRDALNSDIKAAIKAVVGELLPLLYVKGTQDLTAGSQGDSSLSYAAAAAADVADGAPNLALKLRGLSGEGFVHLLLGVFAAVQARLVRAADLRRVIEQTAGGETEDAYAAAAVAAALARGAEKVEEGKKADRDEGGAAAEGSAAAAGGRGTGRGSERGAAGASSVSNAGNPGRGGLQEGGSAGRGNTTKQLRAEVLRENAEAVADACDVAHGRWAKLLGVRQQQHARLGLTDFVDFYTLTSHFIAATERVGGRLGYSIRGALQSQAKAFVDTFHATKMARMNALLDKELWSAVDAPPQAQKLVDFFERESLEGRGEVPTDGLANGNGSTDANPNSRAGAGAGAGGTSKGEGEQTGAGAGGSSGAATPGEGGEGPGSGSAGGSSATSSPAKGRGKGEGEGSGEGASPGTKKAAKTLVCHGDAYHVCNSFLELLGMSREYITVSESLPMLAGEVVHRLSDLLKLFNSRTCQLVLGAGAMQVSGLKSITAKHLALSSQCISLVFALLPDIRRILASHVPDVRRNIVMAQLDRVAQDYRVHRDEILSKLVAIMRERLLVHLRSLPAVAEGYLRPDEPDANASNFARALTKEVGVLHRILAPLLLESDLRSIFTRVVALFHAQLADSFAKIETPTEMAKLKMQRDMSLILKCLRSLPTNAVPRHDSKPRELEQLLIARFGTPERTPTPPPAPGPTPAPAAAPAPASSQPTPPPPPSPQEQAAQELAPQTSGSLPAGNPAGLPLSGAGDTAATATLATPGEAPGEVPATAPPGAPQPSASASPLISEQAAAAPEQSAAVPEPSGEALAPGQTGEAQAPEQAAAAAEQAGETSEPEGTAAPAASGDAGEGLQEGVSSGAGPADPSLVSNGEGAQGAPAAQEGSSSAQEGPDAEVAPQSVAAPDPAEVHPLAPVSQDGAPPLTSDTDGPQEGSETSGADAEQGQGVGR